MIGDTGGHRRTPLLPSAFLRPLSQRPMRMMKIVAHSSNPTEGIMPIRPTRKAQVLRPFRALRIRSVRLNRSMALVLAIVQPKSATTWANLPLPKIGRTSSLLNPPALPMFDHLGIDQALGDPHQRGRGSAAGASTRHRIGST